MKSRTSEKLVQFETRQTHKYGGKFDNRQLAPQFAQYFNDGQRIRVRFPYGEVKTGTVGVTGGWRPTFMLMLTSRSIGSSWLLSGDCEITGIKDGRGYRALAS
jgi:hypothetical protein